MVVIVSVSCAKPTDGSCPPAGKRGFAEGGAIFVDAAPRPSLYRSRCITGRSPPRAGHASLARDLGVMTVIGLTLGLAGPFGMFAEPVWRRLIEWLVFALGGYLFFRPAIAAGRALAAEASLPHLLATFAGCALAALPTTLLVALTLAGWRFPLLSVGTLIGFYPQVLLIGLGVSAILALVDRSTRAGAAAASGDAPPIAEVPPAAPPPPPEPHARAPGAAFLDRLPSTIGGELLCVANEDHYVRAHTSAGSTLLLMRLRDAAAELEGVDGARVHRGWWVARAAVAEVVRRDRAVALRLVNGLEVPVARSEVPALRAAGWL